jgi:hypothetical protein
MQLAAVAVAVQRQHMLQVQESPNFLFEALLPSE